WGQFAKAEQLEHFALGIVRKVLARDNEQTGVHLLLLADTLRQQGKYEQAKPYLVEAVKLLGNVRGKGARQNYATAVNNLGALYFWLGQYSRAEPLLLKGLRIRRLVLGPKHLDTANSLADL